MLTVLVASDTEPVGDVGVDDVAPGNTPEEAAAVNALAEPVIAASAGSPCGGA